MKTALILLAAVLLGGILMLGFLWGGEGQLSGPTPAPQLVTGSPSARDQDSHRAFLYGRVTTHQGESFTGRLRWGGDEEALWSQYLNGTRKENVWVAYLSPDELPSRRHPIEVFGVEIAHREVKLDLDRPFMARFGDITRIEAEGLAVLVTLKSGTSVELDRRAAGDFDDGLRVWDRDGGVHDLGSRQIRSIDFLPTAPLGGTSPRLYGTVHTRQDSFTGLLQWNRRQCLGADALRGRDEAREVALRFSDLRSIERHSADSAQVTLRDGRQIVLAGTRDVGEGNLGIYVDDPRYGRVLVPWDTFTRVDFSAAGGDSGYEEFPPGEPLHGEVTTRAGERLAGRLVYDLDESETTETLDAPMGGVDYTIPFGRIATIVPPEGAGRSPRVILHGGEELRPDPAGDLGPENAGMLVFLEDHERPRYVAWSDIERIDLERSP